MLVLRWRCVSVSLAVCEIQNCLVSSLIAYKCGWLEKLGFDFVRSAALKCEHAFPACYWTTVPPTVKFWFVIEDCCDLCPNPSPPSDVSDDARLFIMLLCLPNLVRFTGFLEVFKRGNFICLDLLTASVSKAKQIYQCRNPTGWRLAVRSTGLFWLLRSFSSRYWWVCYANS